MKRLLFSLLSLIFAVSAYGQNYMVVNSERIFKSQADYVSALEQIDRLAREEQGRVDAKFSEVEQLYNRYMRVKGSLSLADQRANEEQILKLEQEAVAYQESIFGNEGSLMKFRVELIGPIQKRVFGAIEGYAEDSGYDLVIDSSSNPTLIYNSERVDKTEAVIERLKE